MVMRIVIDTNVCLDLFLFKDSRCATLMAALKEGMVEAVTNTACRNEWLRVLDYPSLPLDETLKSSCATEFDTHIKHLAPPKNNTPLPLCRDPDDQKFLELARDVNAKTIITKDKALLKLARKTRQAGLFAICKPENWQPEP